MSGPVPAASEEADGGGGGLAKGPGADPLLAKMSAAARHQDIVATVVITIGLVAAMQIMSFFTPPYVLPSPGTVLAALIELLRRDLRHVGITLARWAAGIAFALVVGSALGVVMASARRLAPYLRAMLLIDTGVPALSWMLLAILWFGNPEARIFFILVVLLLPFYAMNVYEGIQALPHEWVEMVEVFRPSRPQLLRFLVFPIEWTYPRLIDIARQAPATGPSDSAARADDEVPTRTMRGGNDAYNDRQVAKRAHLPVAELLTEFERNRAVTIQAVEAADDELFARHIRSAGGVTGPLALVFYRVAVAHVLGHARDIAGHVSGAQSGEVNLAR